MGVALQRTIWLGQMRQDPRPLESPGEVSLPVLARSGQDNRSG